MNDRGKLPDDAFQYYLGLGPSRSYQLVATRYGVTKRGVSKRASAENWQGRLDRINREARESADAKAVESLEAQQVQQMGRMAELQSAVRDVVTPERLRALVGSLLKSALQNGDTAAARLLFERLLGRPRSEPLPSISLDLPDGLETATQVRTAANALLQAVSDGSVAPEDAQKASAMLEAARKSVETEDLEKRLSELERDMKRAGRR